MWGGGRSNDDRNESWGHNIYKGEERRAETKKQRKNIDAKLVEENAQRLKAIEWQQHNSGGTLIPRNIIT